MGANVSKYQRVSEGMDLVPFLLPPLYDPFHRISLSLTLRGDVETFRAVNLRWSLDGKSIILLDKDTFCMAFLLEES